MELLKRNENNLIFFIFFIIIFLGFFLCFIGGYGSDEDTIPMLHVFDSLLNGGRFVSSRFTGNPVAELGIGFLSYYFGSFAANLATYLFLLLGLIFFFLTFSKDKSLSKIIFFLFFCLTSPIIFFDNLEPIDYSWAFFFFSCGVFFLSKKLFEIAVVMFAFAIGTRINYVLFVLFVILFYHFKDDISLPRRINLFICSFIFGGLFYLPIWFDNSFGLSWLTAARPIDQGIFGLLARFSYKIYITLGYVSTFFIFFFFFKNLNKIKLFSNLNVLLVLCFGNLLLFLWIPAEFSYLQLFLIIVLFLIFNLNNKTAFYLICLGNLISWIIFINPINIQYVDNSYCGPKNAISANFKIKVEKGFFIKYLDSREKIKCWVDDKSEKGIKIINGDAIRMN